MNNKSAPQLNRFDKRPMPKAPHEKIILIHGMNSTCVEAFTGLQQNIAMLDGLQNFDIWAFDYDTNRSFADSADYLVEKLQDCNFGDCTVHFLGHSMGGLIARMAVLRHKLPFVRRIVTLATPNHGAINGVTLSYLGQLIALATRTIRPLYVRHQGVIDLVSAHQIMEAALEQMYQADPSRLDGKSYVSIPAQYFHTKRHLGDPPPSVYMGSVTVSIAFLNNLLGQKLVNLRPVHDGIVDERSNQLSPSPTGSSSEASYMITPTDRVERFMHVSHEAAADHDHVTVTSCEEIADLILAVLKARRLDEAGVWNAMTGPPGRVNVRPLVF